MATTERVNVDLQNSPITAARCLNDGKSWSLMSLMVQNFEKSFHAKAQPWLGMLSSLALTGGIGASWRTRRAIAIAVAGMASSSVQHDNGLSSHPPRRHTFLGSNFKAQQTANFDWLQC